MHEAAIADSILAIADKHAAAHPGAQVETIQMRVGAFRNVDPEALTFAFDGLKGSRATCARASLQMETIEAIALCRNHHRYAARPDSGFRCPQCNAGIDELISGNELDVVGCRLSVPVPMEKEQHARIS